LSYIFCALLFETGEKAGKEEIFEFISVWLPETKLKRKKGTEEQRQWPRKKLQEKVKISLPEKRTASPA
jgi:hypothetical protein